MAAQQNRQGDMEVFDRARAIALLNQQATGRVVFVHDCIPIAEPVNYAVIEDGVVFATGPGPEHDTAARGDVLTIQADGFDEGARPSWSVMATGRARIVLHDEDLLASALLALPPWTLGDDSAIVWVPATVVRWREAGSESAGDSHTTAR